MILTVDCQRSLGLVHAESVGGATLVHAGVLEGAVDDGEGGGVLPHFDLDLAGVLEDLSLSVPGDLRLGVSSKPALEPGPLALLQANLLHLSDELRSLLSLSKLLLELLHLDQPVRLPVLLAVDEVTWFVRED